MSYYYPKSERVLAIPYEEISSKVTEIKQFLKIKELNIEYGEFHLSISFHSIELGKKINRRINNTEIIIIKESGEVFSMSKVDFKWAYVQESKPNSITPIEFKLP